MKVLLLSTRPQYQYDDGGGVDKGHVFHHSSPLSSSSPYSSSMIKERSRMDDIQRQHYHKENGTEIIITTTPAVEQQRQQLHLQSTSSFQPQPTKHYTNFSFQNNHTNTSNTTTVSTHSSSSSDAPLFFHISPGTSGSTFLYHATCIAGFPSVHHKSFCISQRRGIENVSESVVKGVRSHFELIRLYSLAYECCKALLHSRKSGKRHNANINNSQSLVSSKLKICNMSLHTWTSEIQIHLQSVLQSGLVGIFDTPYPFLANKVLELAKEWRTTPAIISITERNANEWARSRIKHHGLLVCKTEYSYEELGASEFDILGCYDRAMQVTAAAAAAAARRGSSNATKDDANEIEAVKYFWDIFQYQSRIVNDSNVDPIFQLGMERQMNHHQEVYSLMADYAPDIFGVNNSASTSSRLEEEIAVVDIRQLILAGKDKESNNNDNITKGLQLQWRDAYTKPLTCRARVNWDMENDTLWEFYHRPKMCEVEGVSLNVIPLIIPHDGDAR